jgi:uncharacterized Zn finger protein
MARGGWPRYVSAAEKRAKAERAQAKLRKKLGAIEPVSLEGRALAKQWWGKAWNNNLEAYSDFANRLPRGRAYVRQGAVLDLNINAGTITALVQGSRGSPYKVTIAIKKIPKTTWAQVCQQAAGQLDSVQALLAGELPKAMATLFNDQKAGLFPSPKQITLHCSCPDWADMCKHVAATLYGVGARLDLTPELFFTLRGVQVSDLVGQVVAQESRALLKRDQRRSRRSLSGSSSDLEALFGVSMAEPDWLALTAKPTSKRAAPKKRKSP